MPAIESRQPTHHGWAVNVKDHGPAHGWLAEIDPGDLLSEQDVERVYEQARESFWRAVQEIGAEHGMGEIYSEGRMGGWATPKVQPHDELSDRELGEYEIRFRAFERDVLALMESTRDYFAELLREQVAETRAERDEIRAWTASAPEGHVIAGPAGHWYAMLAGELVARPISLGETQAPAAPLLDADGLEVPGGWYAPEDMPDGERVKVLRELARREVTS